VKNILLIDDDAIMTRHYRDALSSQSFSVTVCHNVSDAFQQNHSEFDLIVCDLMMPSDGFFENVGTNKNLITGLRFVEQIRSNGCDAPCVLLTNLNIEVVFDKVRKSLDNLEDVIIVRKSEFSPLEFSEAAMSLIDKKAFQEQSSALGKRIADSIILKAPVIPGFLTIDLKKLFGRTD